MKIATGIDLVYIPRFRVALKQGGKKFLQRVYLREELNDQRVTHLAGIFAAKEAVTKALNLPTDSWHNIKVIKNSKGAPSIELKTYNLELTTSSLTISHDGSYVIAQFIAMLKE